MNCISLCVLRCLCALCRADLVQNKDVNGFYLHSAENHAAKTQANHCYQIISYGKIINSCFQITHICCARLLEKHKVFVVPASRSKQSHLSLLSWKLTSASEQFNLVRTLLRCWPPGQHACGKNSTVEGAHDSRWGGQMSITLLIWHTFLGKWEKKKILQSVKLQDEDGKGDELLARQTSATVSKTLHVQNIWGYESVNAVLSLISNNDPSLLTIQDRC